MAEYEFETEELPSGETRLTWTKDGVVDALNFWIVPPDIFIEEAKSRVRTGELEFEQAMSRFMTEWSAAGTGMSEPKR